MKVAGLFDGALIRELNDVRIAEYVGEAAIEEGWVLGVLMLEKKCEGVFEHEVDVGGCDLPGESVAAGLHLLLNDASGDLGDASVAARLQDVEQRCFACTGCSADGD